MSQQDNSRKKFGPENNMPPGSEDPKKKSRFNIYWFYGLLFIAIIAFNLFRDVRTAGIEIGQDRFYEILKAGDIFKNEKKEKENTRIFGSLVGMYRN